MSPADLPRFSVTTARPEGCSGQFDPSPFMVEGHLGYIYVGNGRFIRGRFVVADPIQHTCDFLCEDPTVRGRLQEGASYPYLDSYWGDRAELVLDEGRTWQEAEFQPYDAISTRGEVLPGGWDHEHCSICWETIGCGGQAAGFVSGDDWVCGECYRRFVVPKSLDFVLWQAGYAGPSAP
jgi:hypothetical protein